VIALATEFSRKAGPQRLEEQLRRLKALSDRVGTVERNLSAVPAEFKRRDRQSALIKQTVKDFS